MRAVTSFEPRCTDSLAVFCACLLSFMTSLNQLSPGAPSCPVKRLETSANAPHESSTSMANDAVSRCCGALPRLFSA